MDDDKFVKMIKVFALVSFFFIFNYTLTDMHEDIHVQIAHIHGYNNSVKNVDLFPWQGGTTTTKITHERTDSYRFLQSLNELVGYYLFFGLYLYFTMLIYKEVVR